MHQCRGRQELFVPPPELFARRDTETNASAITIGAANDSTCKAGRVAHPQLKADVEIPVSDANTTAGC